MCSPLHRPGDPLPGAGRRTFLRATALTGAAAGLAGAGVVAAAPAVASTAQNTADNVASWQPDPDSPRFTLVVMPDTQYLFDGASLQDEPVKASLRYILEHGRDENIVFLSHLGDLTEHGLEDEFRPLSAAFDMLDRRRVGYSVLAGNHDIDSRTDDQRGRTPYLDAFGPRRMRRLPTFGGATPTATTPATASGQQAVSGWSSRSTGGRPPPHSPGRGTSSPSTRRLPSS